MSANGESLTSSLATVPTPPRVASRIHRVDGAAASSASTSSCTGAVSEAMSASMARSPRANMTAIPCSPIVPDSTTLSPACTRLRDSCLPSGMTPTPAVEMYTPSAAPLPTTFVSPVTICTPAFAAASLMSATISRSSAIVKPSSMTNAADSHCGRAPDTARSFIVPCTATWPMDPPGKRRGETTYESVEKASRSPEAVRSAAASPSCSSSSLRNASRNTASTNAADDLPPAPCASVTTSSSSRGLRCRNLSIRSSTRSSRSAVVLMRGPLTESGPCAPGSPTRAGIRALRGFPVCGGCSASAP